MSLYVGGVMCLFKPLLYLGCRHVRVDGLKGLMGLLGQEDRGVLTGPSPSLSFLSLVLTRSNSGQPYLSVSLTPLKLGKELKESRLDDPLVWAAMPWDSYLDPKKVRWTLGAHDILFANPSAPSPLSQASQKCADDVQPHRPNLQIWPGHRHPPRPRHLPTCRRPGDPEAR